MKKNFVVKTLASTLALAMVVTAAPVMPASAAKAPALNQKSKALYINENDLGSSFDFNVKNKVSGSKYKWTTSNKTIATVNAKNGVVAAGTKTGKATITCKITFKNKKTKSLKATVTVKENATKAEISNLPTEAAPMKIGAEYNFNKKFTTASSAKSTDYQSWEIEEGASNTAGATVNAKNGKVTATKAGEFKIRVRAYQNKTKLAANDTVDSEWATVKVNVSVLEAKQSHDNKVAFTFDDSMKDKLKKADFVIKNKTTNQIMTIKDVTYSEDGKTALVESYLTFEDAKAYVATYNKKDYEFNASVGVPTSFAAITVAAVKNNETEIKYVLKDANGIDVTASNAGKLKIVGVDVANNYLDSANKKITMYTLGSVAKLKAEFHSGDWNTADSKEKNFFEQAFEITCVDKTAASYGNVTYTLNDSAAEVDMTKVTTPCTKIAYKDTDKYLHVNLKDSANNTVLKDSSFTFESGDKTMLLVSSNGIISALNKQGTCAVIIKKDGTPVATVPITVLAERKAVQVKCDTTDVTVSTLVTNLTKVVPVTVLDQHGDKFNDHNNVVNYEVVPATTADAAGLALITNLNKDNFTVTPDAALLPAGQHSKTFNFLIQAKNTLNGGSYKIPFKVTLTDKTGTASNYQVNFTATKMDAVVNATTDLNKSIGFQIAGMSAGNQVTVENPANWTVTARNAYWVPATQYIETVGTTGYKFNVTKTTGTNVVKAPKGTYVIKFEHKNGAVVDLTFEQTIVVEDSQYVPTINVTTTDIRSKNVALNDYSNILKNAAEIKDQNGTNIKDASLITVVTCRATETQVVANGKDLWINSADVTYEVIPTYFTTANIEVKQTITVLN